MRRRRPLRSTRHLRHIREAWRYRGLFLDWGSLLIAYAVGKDVSRGRPVRLTNGMQFAIGHLSDVWTLVQVLGRNDYHVRPAERWHTVIDIGANIGTFAVRAAVAAPEARVYCYEPAPDTCRLLRRNLALNGLQERVTVDQRAVCGSSGEMWLQAIPQSSMRRTSAARTSRLTDTLRVQSTTFETILSEHSLDRCDFLKMDCEGAEYDILRNCSPTLLSRIARIALEFHEWNDEDDHRELVELLQCAAFRVASAYDPLDGQVGYIFAERDG